jgi:hypothetical protein
MVDVPNVLPTGIMSKPGVLWQAQLIETIAGMY